MSVNPKHVFRHADGGLRARTKPDNFYEGSYLIKAHGKYVLFGSNWNGKSRFGPAGRTDGTYDLTYCHAGDILGPYGQPRLAVPHGGHGSLFEGKQKNWWATFFGNDSTTPCREKAAIVRLCIERRGDIVVFVYDGQ